MKMSKLQQFYNEQFKFMRLFYSVQNFKFDSTTFVQYYTSAPNKKLKEFAKSMNTNIFNVDCSSTKHKINTTSKIPQGFDAEIYINGIPCLVLFSQSKLYAIITHSTAETFRQYGYSHDLSCHVLNSNTHKQELMPRGNTAAQFIKDIRTLEPKEYSEEEIFQISTIIPDAEVFIEVLKRTHNINKYLTPNSTVTETILLMNGITK